MKWEKTGPPFSCYFLIDRDNKPITIQAPGFIHHISIWHDYEYDRSFTFYILTDKKTEITSDEYHYILTHPNEWYMEYLL